MATVSAAIGLVIRRMRRDTAKTLDDVAAAAGFWGLKWARSTVANIEAGRRNLSAEELLLMPTVIAWAFDEQWLGFEYTLTLGELLHLADKELGAEDIIELTPAWVVRDSQRLVTERAMSAGASDNLEPNQWSDEPDWDAWEPLYEVGATGPNAVLLRGAAARVTTVDRRLAKRLNDVDPRLLVIGSYRLWGCSFTQHRDILVSTQVDDAAKDKRTLQALRGHVTRDLLAELEPTIRDLVHELPPEMRPPSGIPEA